MSELDWAMFALLVLLNIAAFWAFVKILHRMGFSGWWVLLWLTGPFLIAGLLVLAYAEWPALDKHASRK